MTRLKQVHPLGTVGDDAYRSKKSSPRLLYHEAEFEMQEKAAMHGAMCPSQPGPRDRSLIRFVPMSHLSCAFTCISRAYIRPGSKVIRQPHPGCWLTRRKCLLAQG